MGKRLMLIVACALLVGLVALPAFAEVQNVKVSGDITALGISRSEFNLGTVNESDDKESHAASIVRLRVDADLTENVGTTLRLINERDWGQEAATTQEIDLDLAYITLKEFLYSPLTLTLGRQELQFGNGFIVGDPDTNNNVVGTSLTDDDLSSKKAFDAARATLNYDPLVVDLFWAKINEDTVIGTAANEEKDDVDLFGVNARYDFGGNWKTIGELYYFGKVDNTPRDHTTNTDVNIKTPNTVNTIGGRVEISPMARLNVQGELAIQTGKVNNDSDASCVVKKDAMAAQSIITYALDMKYNPILTAIYSYYSGDKDGAHATNSDKNWDPMFENQTSGHIINVLFNASDAQVLNLRGSIVPVEDLTLTLDYVWLQLAERLPMGTFTLTTYTQNHGTTATPSVNANKAKMHLGDEFDLTLKYDYTDDVQLGLLAGIFLPGNIFINKPADVKEVIASVKVDF